MPLRYIKIDEWYPVFTLREESHDWDHNDSLDLTDAELADYDRVMREFDLWQTRMREAEESDTGMVEEAIMDAALDGFAEVSLALDGKAIPGLPTQRVQLYPNRDSTAVWHFESPTTVTVDSLIVRVHPLDAVCHRLRSTHKYDFRPGETLSVPFRVA